MSNKKVKFSDDIDEREKDESESGDDEKESEIDDGNEGEIDDDDDDDDDDDVTNNNNNNNKIVNNPKKERKLTDIFVVPPISVLDVKQGYWKKQRKMWFDDFGISKTCDGRKENALKLSKLMAKKQKTTSVFDPVVCEVAYKWFSAVGDDIYDPFAGGAVRGMVACFLERTYIGVDIRTEQVDENDNHLNASVRAYKQPYSNYTPKWIAKDSNQYVPDHYDLLFTCPPYFDLEQYSSNKGDLSNMQFDEFLKA